MAIAFFDMDGTIVNADTNELTLEYYCKLGLAKRDEVIPKFNEYQKQFFEGKVNIEEPLVYAAKPLLNLSKEKLQDVLSSAIKENVLPNVQKGALKAIDFHKKRNDTIVIVTSTSDYIARSLATHLGFDDVIASPFEMKDGVLTGSIKGIIPFQEDKVVRINQFLSKNNISLEDSYAYGDSVNDLPMLMMCDHRYAVNPNQKLLDSPLINELTIVNWS